MVNYDNVQYNVLYTVAAMVEHIAIYYDTAHGITYKDMYNTMHIQCTVKYDITEYNRIQHNIIWYDTI